jgi:Protein of unknown function (DUF4089)
MTKRLQKSRRLREAPRSKAVRPDPRDPLDVMIDTYAKILNLKVDKAWKPAIRGHLNVIFQLGALVQDFKLPYDAEPAPVFKP